MTNAGSPAGEARGHLLTSFAVAVAMGLAVACNRLAHAGTLTVTTATVLVLVLLSLQVLLAGLYFLHLRRDWGRVYFFVLPAVSLAAVLVVALLPDMVLAWYR